MAKAGKASTGRRYGGGGPRFGCRCCRRPRPAADKRLARRWERRVEVKALKLDEGGE